MLYAVAISNSNLDRLFVCESNEIIEIGERVVVGYRDKKVTGYVVNKAFKLEDFSDDVKFLISDKLVQLLDRLDYVSFLESSRVNALLQLANIFGSGIGRYFDISFPPEFDKYFSLFVESVNPLVNIPKMPYEEFKKMKKYREYISAGIVRVFRDFETQKPRPRSKEKYVHLKAGYESISKLRFTASQSVVVNYLLLNGCVELDRLLEDTEVKKDVLVQLKNKKIIEILDYKPEEVNQTYNVILDEEQTQVVKDIILNETVQKHMLFGPTGSGKTEVYMEIMKNYLPFGSVLYLVPEVSLTEQTIARLRRKFPDLSIALYHSYLTSSKRVEVWAKAVKGEVDILVGPRSAAFVPLKNLKLVIVDEEHDEGYYNNSEPFYDVHTFLDLLPVTAVYGSATPSLVTYKKAIDGIYNFNKLTKRYNVSLPDVDIVDMRKEKKVTSSISESLYKAIDETIKEGKSVLIFARRKGFSRVQCAVCGHIVKCDNCDVSMTYHMEMNKLKCHLCGNEKSLLASCPNCGATLFIDKGTGTEKVEKELRELFPGKNIGRIDAEIIDTPEKLKKVFEALREGELEIVVGTKMITKGIDIYKIGLVGVIDIDALISYPDINAPLKTFQLLVQVIGRAGRKEKGRAVIQTYNPENPIITYAQEQNVEEFYKRELTLRGDLNYPPFSNVVQITYANLDPEIAKETIDAVSNELENMLYSERFSKKPIELLGPSEHPIFKMANKYRYQLLLKTAAVEEILKVIKKVIANYSGDWTIKVNPTEI